MYLGIDVGTSSVKGVVADETGAVVANAEAPLRVSVPKPLWSEQDPNEWWDACQKVLNSLKTHLLNIKAIGVTGQQHGAVLLNAHGSVLRPAILWNDMRAHAECKKLLKAVPSAHEITSNLIYPGFTAPKVLWVQEHEPDVFEKIAKVILPKDYIRYMLTGEFAMDQSDASGTSWLDVSKRSWSEEMIEATGLTLSQMPTLCEGTDETGYAKTEFGFAEKVPVVGGGGDNPAGAISVNCVSNGDAFISLGTSGVYFVAADSAKTNVEGGVHTMCHCIPKTWHHMTVHLSAASCFSFAQKITGFPSVQEALSAAEHQFSQKPDLLFLPYLSGERSPINAPHAKGVFYGMTQKTTKEALIQATLEGVALNFAAGQEEMIRCGIEIKEVSVVGGGARSLFFGSLLSSALDRSLIYRKDREVGAALGAARLACISIEKRNPDTAFADSPIEHTIEPDRVLVSYYKEKREAFQELTQTIIPFFARKPCTSTM